MADDQPVNPFEEAVNPVNEPVASAEEKKDKFKKERAEAAAEVKKDVSKNEREEIKSDLPETPAEAAGNTSVDTPIEPVNPFALADEPGLGPKEEKKTEDSVDAKSESVSDLPETQQAGIFKETHNKQEKRDEEHERKEEEKKEKEEEHKEAEQESPTTPIEPVNPFEASAVTEPELIRAQAEKQKEEEATPEDTGETEEKQTDDNNAEVVEGEVVSEGGELGGIVSAGGGSEEVAEEKPDMDEFKEDIWDMLEQAGITKKRIKMALIILVTVILLLIAYFSNWFGLFGGGGDEPSGDEDAEVSEEVNTEAVIYQATSDSYGVISSYIFGLEFAQSPIPIIAEPITTWAFTAGVRAVMAFGDMSMVERQDFVHYIDVLREIKNLYETDIYALIDLSVDRRKVLGDLLDELSALIDEADQITLILEQKLTQLESEFELKAEERDNYETAFFTSVDGLLGQTAYEYLQLFISSSQETDKIKADYSAHDILYKKYIQYVAAIKLRFKDIDSNQTAIIKGVRVFDIPGSDIDAIIPLTE